MVSAVPEQLSNARDLIHSPFQPTSTVIRRLAEGNFRDAVSTLSHKRSKNASLACKSTETPVTSEMQRSERPVSVSVVNR